MTCERGFSLVSETCQCELDDICEAESPCVNGGTCLKESLPTDYQCQCINKYRGRNCTGWYRRSYFTNNYSFINS